MGCEIGRIRPTKVFERAGESRMTPPAASISSQVRPRISFLRQPLRRFDCVLAPSKTKVLAEHARRKGSKIEGEALDRRLNSAVSRCTVHGVRSRHPITWQANSRRRP